MCVKKCQCNTCHKRNKCFDCKYNAQIKNVNCRSDGVQDCPYYVKPPEIEKVEKIEIEPTLYEASENLHDAVINLWNVIAKELRLEAIVDAMAKFLRGKKFHNAKYCGMILITWENAPMYLYNQKSNVVSLWWTHQTNKPANADELVIEYIKTTFGIEPIMSPFCESEGNVRTNRHDP